MADDKLDPVLEDANAEALCSEPIEEDNQKASDEQESIADVDQNHRELP